MDRNSIKLIITGVVLFVLFIVAVSILKAILRVIVPFAIVVIAGYIVYRVIKKR